MYWNEFWRQLRPMMDSHVIQWHTDTLFDKLITSTEMYLVKNFIFILQDCLNFASALHWLKTGEGHDRAPLILIEILIIEIDSSVLKTHCEDDFKPFFSGCLCSISVATRARACKLQNSYSTSVNNKKCHATIKYSVLEKWRGHVPCQIFAES